VTDPHTYIPPGPTRRKKIKFLKLTLQTIKAHNARHKNNCGVPGPGPDPLPPVHGGSGGDGDTGRREAVGVAGPVHFANGYYCPLVFFRNYKETVCQ